MKKSFCVGIVFALTIIGCFGDQASVDFNNPFNEIYEKGTWNKGQGPLSGPGSDACAYLRYLILLQHIVDFQDIESIVELGFGDFQMNQHIIFQGKKYKGYDVAKKIMRQSTIDTQFTYLTSLENVKDKGDLLITKDVMQHWPNSQGRYYIDKILPNFKYALVTNDISRNTVRNDISPGGWQLIPISWVPHSEQVLTLNVPGAPYEKVSQFYTNPSYTNNIAA